jgi:NADPH-dependent 2,4-dienoyl-CoA reductase/sulfur reductase-like enzyme
MRLLVIGGIAAGLSAAARARRIDPNLEILVLEKGDTVSYGAC